MRICANCKKEKDEEEMVKNKAKKSGFSNYCKECKRILDNLYYKNNESRRLQIRKTELMREEEIFKCITEYLETHPCVDCGNNDLRVLEFDHLDDKKDGIMIMVRNGVSIKSLLVEISKCEIRCANCHKIRHAVEQNSWRNKIMKKWVA